MPIKQNNMKKSIKVLIIIAIIVVLSLIMVALEQGAGIGVPKIIIAIILIVVVPIIWRYEPNNDELNNKNNIKEDGIDPSPLLNLTENQKMSFINLLIGTTALNTNRDQVVRKDILNKYCGLLNVYGNNSSNYLSKYGNDRMIEDLKSLTFIQKELLTGAVVEIMQYTIAKNSEQDWIVAVTFLNKIGISEDDVVNTITKYGRLK